MRNQNYLKSRDKKVGGGVMQRKEIMRIVEMNEDKKKNLSTPVCVCARDSPGSTRVDQARVRVCVSGVRAHKRTSGAGRFDSDFPFTHRHHHAASPSAPSLSVSKMLPFTSHLPSPDWLNRYHHHHLITHPQLAPYPGPHHSQQAQIIYSFLPLY